MTDKDVPLSIDDVVDFYRQWPSLRLRVQGIVDAPQNDADQAEILNWMIKIIDRIGPNDLAPNESILH